MVLSNSDSNAIHPLTNISFEKHALLSMRTTEEE
jgi:hypothetical protein